MGWLERIDSKLKLVLRSLAWLFGSAILLSTGGALAASWSYDTRSDPMTGKETKSAWVDSDNSLSLDFPYAGRNHGLLQVRRHPKYGLDVIVSIEKGQLMCRSYEPCRIAVRFDDRKPVTFTGYPSADQDSTVVFLEPESRFIESAKKAKRILVQLTLYRGGDQVLIFSTPSSLNWQSPGK